MRKLLLGMIAGLILGSSLTAIAAGIFGTGELTGWTVMKDGEEVCSDPSVDPTSKEIDCD